MFDEGIGNRENRLGGSVVVLQFDHHRIGEILIELKDISHMRPPPSVDTLIIVPYDAEIVVSTAQFLE